MTEVINNISDFEKYLKNTKKVVEEALDLSLGPENPEILRESMRYSLFGWRKKNTSNFMFSILLIGWGRTFSCCPYCSGDRNDPYNVLNS